MKVKELIEELSAYEDFDVEFGLFEPDGSSWGCKLRTFSICIDDIGYSSKVIKLGVDKER
jgi:hypothetical protein